MDWHEHLSHVLGYGTEHRLCVKLMRVASLKRCQIAACLRAYDG